MYMDDTVQIIGAHFNNMSWPKWLKWLIKKQNRTLAQTVQIEAMIYMEKEP